jgi:hypothetical protein
MRPFILSIYIEKLIIKNQSKAKDIANKKITIVIYNSIGILTHLTVLTLNTYKALNKK